jgi:hypothetical protein
MRLGNQCQILVQLAGVFHVEHSNSFSFARPLKGLWVYPIVKCFA